MSAMRSQSGWKGVEKIKELTGGYGAHSVIEAVGTQESMLQAIRSTRPGGHVGYVGVSHDVALDGQELFFSHAHLHGGPAPVCQYLPQLIDLIWNRQINAGKVFDLTLPLDRAADAYRAMDERRAIKVLLVSSSPVGRPVSSVTAWSMSTPSARSVRRTSAPSSSAPTRPAQRTRCPRRPRPIATLDSAPATDRPRVPPSRSARRVPAAPPWSRRRSPPRAGRGHPVPSRRLPCGDLAERGRAGAESVQVAAVGRVPDER
jgi:hypothetical protein